MNEVIQEIKDHFAAGINGLRKIVSLPYEFSAYSYRNAGIYGLAIEYPDEKEINEAANEVLYSTQTLVKESGEKKYLLLTCLDEEYRNQFAELSYSFINPGENGEKREVLLTDPILWWNRWTELLGDKKSKKGSYDVLAELIALDYLFQQDKTTRWSAAEAGTHDIESDSQSYEIKSTTKKSESHITISSRFQLESANKLELFFFRLECSQSGFSINDVVESLERHGYDQNLIESQLEAKGFVKGRSTRSIKYTILEVRRFDVDDNFPKIVEKSFKGDVFPKNIVKILYTIDLEGIDYTSLSFIKNEDNTISATIVKDINNTSGSKYNSDKDTNESSEVHIFSEYEMGRIPLYSLRAACGYFEDGELPEEEGWVDATGQGFTPDPRRHFVVHAKGDSMLPKIKDGDLCIFEWYKAGSRNGEIVLTQSNEFDSEYGGKYTIKEYHSEKVITEEGWQHSKVELIPLNKDFDVIELDEETEYRTIGILKCVM